VTDVAVEVDNLSKTYLPASRALRFLLRTQIREPVVALDGVAFTVPVGGLCVVAGQNGAGKSTLFRSLVGLVVPTTGSAAVLGLDVVEQSRAVRAVIGYMASDDRTLWLRLSCIENVGFHARLRGVPPAERRTRVDKALRGVGLADVADRSGFALSGGMRARLQLACALVGRPSVLILDEPTSALDPVAAYELASLVRSLAEDEGIAVLISTHRVDEIEALGRRVLLLHRGRLIHDGPVDELGHAERPVIELHFMGVEAAAWARSRLAALPDTSVSGEANTVEVVSAWPVGQVLVALEHHLEDLESVTERRQPLRDVLTQVLASVESVQDMAVRDPMDESQHDTDEPVEKRQT
jgi:ABC-2 type transport system ATP-binding protein